MGLCKCERKRVTNLFCFEHRVNVCEFCLVANHNKCIVKSYLRWLKDSDFTPSCYICHNKFDDTYDKDCVRLVCLDVFHWECLDNLLSKLPPTTTPAGYVCPLCSQPIIPQENHGGPVAEALRIYLKKAIWANNGFIESLPVPISDKHINQFPELEMNKQDYNTVVPNGKLLDPRLDVAADQFLQGQDVTSLLELSRMDEGYTESLKYSHAKCERREHFSVHNLSKTTRDDEDKYKRTNPSRWFKRFLRSQSSRSCILVHKRKNRIMFFMIFFIFLIFIFGLYNSRPDDDNVNPFLDFRINPNIPLDQDRIHNVLD